MRRRAARLLLAGCLIGVAAGAAAEVRKWVDAAGRTHYGDRPPAGQADGTQPLRGTVSVGDGITLVPAAPGAPAGTVPVAAPSAQTVWIYTTRRCGYCTRAKAHMTARGIRFVEKDIEANPQYAAEFRALGGRGVPVTLAGAQRIDGYRKPAFDAFLKQAGF